jgi:hypothetical protein
MASVLDGATSLSEHNHTNMKSDGLWIVRKLNTFLKTRKPTKRNL